MVMVRYFGNTKHAFTEPHAADIGAPELGRIYDAVAAERTWRLMQDFLQEVFQEA